MVIVFDIMTRLGESAAFDTVEAEVKEVEGVRVRVATPAALYRLKKDTVRPLNHRDAATLASGSNVEATIDVAVQKFRSAEEMNAALVQTASGNAFDRFVRHCARYWAISPRIYPRGVFKFRTIEEAQIAQERVTNEGQCPPQSSA